MVISPFYVACVFALCLLKYLLTYLVSYWWHTVWNKQRDEKQFQQLSIFLVSAADAARLDCMSIKDWDEMTSPAVSTFNDHWPVWHTHTHTHTHDMSDVKHDAMTAVVTSRHRMTSCWRHSTSQLNTEQQPTTTKDRTRTHQQMR